MTSFPRAAFSSTRATPSLFSNYTQTDFRDHWWYTVSGSDVQPNHHHKDKSGYNGFTETNYTLGALLTITGSAIELGVIVGGHKSHLNWRGLQGTYWKCVGKNTREGLEGNMCEVNERAKPYSRDKIENVIAWRKWMWYTQISWVLSDWLIFCRRREFADWWQGWDWFCSWSSES